MAGGGPVGPAASELKRVKIYLSAKYNYLKFLFLTFSLLMEICMYFVINSSN
jgi:hypothetical protein